MGSACTSAVTCTLSPPRGKVNGQYKQDARRCERPNETWRKMLSAQEFLVMRQCGTDRPNTGLYNKAMPTSGYFQCRACGTPLYSWRAKFKCGCGWPAFSKGFKGHIKTRSDSSHGMSRNEVRCVGCDSHIGHVFVGEGYTETNERHCVNSSSIHYIDQKPPKVPEVTFVV